MVWRWGPGAGLFWAAGLTLASPASAAEQPEVPPAEERAGPEEEAPHDEMIVVVGTTPVHASGLPPEKVPANVQVATSDDLSQLHSLDLSDFMNEGLASVSVNQAQNNPLQPDVQFRGFTGSPLLGNAQGLAAYVDGVRINEVFGDTLNWDLVPEVAISEINFVPGSNPTFGLNTLGGALSIRTKTGWTHPNLRAEITGGSGWRRSLELEAGGSASQLGYYLAGNLLAEDGWRDHSPTDLRQLFGNVGWRGPGTEVNLSVVAARSSLTGNGASPVQLLSSRRSAVFTHPDNTRNSMLGVAVRGTRDLAGDIKLTGNAYLRALWTTTFNGDASDFEPCEGPVNAGLLCREHGGEEVPLLDTAGNAVPFDSADPLNAINNTTDTAQRAYGGTLQVVMGRKIFQRENQLVAGAGYSGGTARFSSQAELGRLAMDRSTIGTGIVDAGSLVGLVTQSHHLGAYVTDTFDLLPELSLTFSGRFNWSIVQLVDQVGTELNGFHRFARFNPAVGVAYQPWRWWGAYASYSESSRAPTPVELSCADEDDPCRLPNSFVADPPLSQVVARTLEGGVRGHLSSLGGGRLRYGAAAFRTASDDDILFISSSALASEGFFSNVGSTLRQGVELTVAGETGTLAEVVGQPVSLSGQVHYSYIQATFLTSFEALSPNHPEADPVGHLLVPSGASIPGIPSHIVKGGVKLGLGAVASVGASVAYNSSQYFRGDEANLLEPVPGYLVVNLLADVRLSRHFGLFLKVSNLFDARYATFGVLARASDVLGPSFDDPRFIGPGAPRSFWAGVHAEL